MRSKRLVSSGGVIFRVVNGNFEVALISRGRVWCLPKGIIEEGETAAETALREVREETGLEGEIVEKIGEISYHFSRGKSYLKNVHFFLLKYVKGSITAHDSEAEKVSWFPLSRANEILTYFNEKRILRKAESLLSEESSR